MQPLIIAHRGASADAPENTLRAFALAREQGAEMIELDVRPTQDGAIIVFHDDTTERWNGQPEPIGALPWSALHAVRVGGEAVPLFRDVVAWAQQHSMLLNVEIKVPGIEQVVAQIIRDAGIDEQVVVSSFYPQVLRTLREKAPHLHRGALMGVRTLRPRVRVREAMPLLTLRSLGAYAWHPAYQLPFLPRIVRAVRQRGYKVNVWTVDDPFVMRQLIALPVDGIITNRPQLLREVLAQGPVSTPQPARRRPRRSR